MRKLVFDPKTKTSNLVDLTAIEIHQLEEQRIEYENQKYIDSLTPSKEEVEIARMQIAALNTLMEVGLL